MPRGNRSYKELTLQQLRSLCETADQGSFIGAARALGLSQPTVWKQVHALEVRLITAKDHPLARSRVVRPQDLSQYPIINRPPAGDLNAFARIVLELHGSRAGTGDLVHTGFASSIRRFVKLGYGIGLIPMAPSVPSDPDLHERPMRRYL